MTPKIERAANEKPTPVNGVKDLEGEVPSEKPGKASVAAASIAQRAEPAVNAESAQSVVPEQLKARVA
jgi:hypothetical protein